MQFRLAAVLGGLAAIAAGAATLFAEKAAPAAPAGVVTVYKSPTCGCCGEWIEHMKAAGFEVRAVDMDDITEVKQASGVPMKLRTCHTAIVDGYVVEGHVPADLVKKMLAEKPKVTGIAVPGMPVGSPGMEQGSMKEPYDVLLFEKSGKTSVYAKR
ncbi:MAG: DUF411 domain-containing protein [Gemmatimonadota bacterium]|jgi:hypothetical protein|nr:DUF411 domain-containing protein [Gemmatimonadota bacterium]